MNREYSFTFNKAQMKIETDTPVTIIYGGIGSGKSLALTGISYSSPVRSSTFLNDTDSCLRYIREFNSLQAKTLALQGINTLLGSNRAFYSKNGDLYLKKDGPFADEKHFTELYDGELILCGMVFFVANLFRTSSLILIDNIENCFSLDIQESLLTVLTEIAPNCTFFVTSNSPAIPMRGRLDCMISTETIWSRIKEDTDERL